MTDKQLERMTKHITAAPLAEMEALTNRLSDLSDRAAIAGTLTAQALGMLRKAEYLDARSSCGSDNGHEEGVKRQNKILAKVRKALYFTYHHSEVYF